MHKQARFTEFHNMRVWDGDGGQISFAATPEATGEGRVATPPLGYIAENKLLISALHQSLCTRGVNVYSTEAVAINSNGASENKDWPRVTLRDGRVLTARLVIGADGGNSVVRSHLAPPLTGWSYSQMGVVATVRHLSHFSNNTSWQRFLPTGPIALLPLHGNYSSIVWSTNIPHAEYLLALDDEAFVNEVQNAFSAPITPAASYSLTSSLFSTLGHYITSIVQQPPPSVPDIVSVAGKRGAFPLRFEHALNYVGHRVALVGDAAHTIHPLAGQGVNLGLADAAVFASLIAEAAEVGMDIGGDGVLAAYERRQKISNHLTMLMLDALKGTFLLPPLLAPARVVALGILDHLPPIKVLVFMKNKAHTYLVLLTVHRFTH